MVEKRTGLGRGLGALIPTEPEPAVEEISAPVTPTRPVDIFFPPEPAKVVKAGTISEEERQHRNWEVAAADGRLGLRPQRTRLSAMAIVDDGLAPVPGAKFAEVPIDAIYPNARQPRREFDEPELKELVDSIREVGVLQPIVVRPDKHGDDRYELIMGERRWRAATAAGSTTIPVIIRETEDSEMLRAALLENLHRANLNPIEEAAAYRQLLDDFGCTQAELSEKIARSRPQITNTLRLLNLPPLVQKRVASGTISAGHARALLGLEDPTQIEELAQRIIAEGLSVRAIEEIVNRVKGDKKPTRVARMVSVDPAVEDLANRLSSRFGTRVDVRYGKTVGRVTVEFRNANDLNRILGVMAPDEQGLPETEPAE